jgi:hypothetical protein
VAVATARELAAALHIQDAGRVDWHPNISKPNPRARQQFVPKGLGVIVQGGGSMAEPSAPAADSDAAAASGSAGGGRVATVVLRASTDNLLDDLERAIDDGVNNYKVFPDRVSGLAVYM